MHTLLNHVQPRGLGSGYKQKAGLDGNAYLPYLGQSMADNLFVQDFVQLGAFVHFVREDNRVSKIKPVPQ